MPHLVRLYIRQSLIGFGISAVFVTLLLALNVANLGHLVLTSDMGWVAGFMLWFFNGIVFAGVQFALALPDGNVVPRSGRKEPVWLAEPVPVRVDRQYRQ
ncbi:hypothetical protein [Qingshengfaniella alkalisoli]|uniref:Uncharacterized protein n=1 Tax=Qingshengfaniella alkalisoli TaxID=2599296 RepID=A0A5B8IWA8_9RHOB|nr:hypothetical protein [Qingshengfaniella alkalisoli]QDY68808.1 hypothetical protein FPZ52_03635 [Qingshengfaniella alkalisoli]